MTQVPPESKAWPTAGAEPRPSSSGEQGGRVGQPVDETSAAARAEHARESSDAARGKGDPRGRAKPNAAGPGEAQGLQQPPRSDGDGSVQEAPRSPSQRTD